MLKPSELLANAFSFSQPPSGGCVLKHKLFCISFTFSAPAAFGRLCVETLSISSFTNNLPQPPSGGCVLKPSGFLSGFPSGFPAAFGRLCVETGGQGGTSGSGGPAAFGRLCVETYHATESKAGDFQPPSGGCVLKPMWQ